MPGDWEKDDLVLANVGFTFDLSSRMQVYGGFSQGAEIARLSRAARGDQHPEALTAEAAPSDQYELGARRSLRFAPAPCSWTAAFVTASAPDPSRRRRVRALWLSIHLYIGLTAGPVLAVLGLTSHTFLPGHRIHHDSVKASFIELP